VDLPILLFTLVAGLSVVTAVDPRYSLEEFIGEWVTGICLFYLMVNNVRPEQIKYILGALLLGIIPYVFLAVFFLKKKSHRFILLILLSLNLFALLLTYSVGSWVAIMVLALVAGWIFAPRKVFILFLLLIGLIIFLGAPQKVFQYYDRLTASNTYPDFYNARWILTKFTLEKIKEAPFQMNGFGSRTFAKKFRGFVEKYKGAQMWHTHNTFLNVAIQTGLQGLLLFCFLLYRLLKYCQGRENLGEWLVTKYFSLATFMMIITFFPRNLSDDFFIDDSALLFWFLCGMVFALNHGVDNRMPAGECA
jgi:O-antigen ligase